MTAKPRVHLFGAGGTIAGTGESSTTLAYESGRVEASALVDAVEGLDRLAEVSAETLFMTGSEDLGPSQWMAMARRIQDVVEGADVDGVVVTHGTDTLEEAAFFLDLTVRTEKPVVMTGAMRASTALGADGPANIHQAVMAATSVESRGRGVLVAMNGLLLPGWQVVKTHSAALESFRAYPGGPVGRIIGDRLMALATTGPSPLVGRFHGNLETMAECPSVGVAYLYGGCGEVPIRVWSGTGIRGLVVAGFGAGTMPGEFAEAARDLAETGCVVVVSSRVGEAAVHPETMTLHGDGGLISSGFLNPQKSAVLLKLALAADLKAPDIAELFDRFSASRGGPA